MSEKEKQAQDFVRLSVDIDTEAEKIVDVLLPQKLDELNEVIKSGKLFPIDFTLIGDSIDAFESALKASESHKASLDINMLIEKVHKYLYKEFSLIGEWLATIHLWIVLHNPPISDGDNNGVAVQFSVSSIVNKLYHSIVYKLTSFENYHNSRAKLGIKCIKYPDVEGFHKSLFETDKSHYLSLKEMVERTCSELVILVDSIRKEKNSILHPQTEKPTADFGMM